MSRVRLLALVLLALLFVAAPAGAAVKPRFLGTGHDPGIAVDTAGTAHVGWFTQDDTLEYCQVPRRARRCTLRRSSSSPTSASARPRCWCRGRAS